MLIDDSYATWTKTYSNYNTISNGSPLWPPQFKIIKKKFSFLACYPDINMYIELNTHAANEDLNVKKEIIKDEGCYIKPYVIDKFITWKERIRGQKSYGNIPQS